MPRISERLGLVGLFMLAGGSPAVRADVVSLSYSGSLPSGHAAAAAFTFNDVANTVTIRISNTMGSAYNSIGSRDLTALFWNFTNAGPLTVTRVGGDATNVTSVDGGRPFGSGTHSYDAKQLWAFRDDLGGSPFGASYGLSAAGLGIFGNQHMLQGGGPHPQPDGPDGTIISPTGDPFSINNPREQFRGYVEFAFSVGSSFFAGGIHNIGVTNLAWQFDTSMSGPSIVLVPLPSAAYVGFASLAGLGAVAWVRRRRPHAAA
jgi:hypothetical protein